MYMKSEITKKREGGRWWESKREDRILSIHVVGQANGRGSSVLDGKVGPGSMEEVPGELSLPKRDTGGIAGEDESKQENNG